jgi:phosphohistidine swiveling domain-containing protein
MSAIDWLLPFDAPTLTLPVAGGKGTNLVRLARAGFPVPPGFVVTTDAYHAFVEANYLQERILALVNAIRPDDPAALDGAAAQIHEWFRKSDMPDDLVTALLLAYANLRGRPVAVRSSATAEDLPDLSFAGQQDTYLNVVGPESLRNAVRDCWASLWTARAIGYRARNAIPQDAVALAVVVQTMIQSEASGVLFTANPLSGLRSETVIDATLGLGEALVSGQVDPDHYVVDTATRTIREKRLGAKALAIRGVEAGGTIVSQENASTVQALPDEQIQALTELGARVQAEYDAPQDIEWAWAGGQLYLLQARPITSLFPVPEGFGPDDLHVLISFGAVQGMLEPMTPLGRDTIRAMAAAVAGLFGMERTYATQDALRVAGERLWLDATAIVRNAFGRRLIAGVLTMVEPSVVQAITSVWDDPRLQAEGDMRLSTRLRLLRFALPLFGHAVRNLINPDGRRAWFDALLDRDLAELREQAAGTPASLDTAIALLDRTTQGLPQIVRPLLSVVVAGQAAINLLRMLGSGLPAPQAALWIEITRGLPHNVTTQMDLRLWDAARAIRADAAATQRFAQDTPDALATAYQAGALPPVAQQAVADFLAQYGARGVGEIDFGRPRWNEDPRHVLQVIQSYLQIEDEQRAPDAVFARGAQVADAAAEQLVAALRRTRGGWFKARQARFLISRYRALGGLRESPKFYAVRAIGVLRAALLEAGRAQAAAGVLTEPDDLFYLSPDELRQLAGASPAPTTPETSGPPEWRALVMGRRVAADREARRRQIPRVLLSDGRAFYEGMAAPAGSAGDALTGSPVSPGVVEGAVHVVLDPHAERLAPGEILVCPGTDPAWTPLFLAAGGLVMEVGGMMTHGSVVAREYGIPAVVGVHQATTRLRNGQRVRVDGTAGTVEVLSS